MEPQSLERSAPWHWTASRRILIALFVCALAFWLNLHLWLGWSPITSTPASNVDITLHLDPNTATWAQLAAIPELGEKTARNIVAYRQSQQAKGLIPFRTLADLDAVPGIGPGKLKLFEPYLRFAPTQP